MYRYGMKRNPDLSATIAKSAQEAKDLLRQTAAVIDGEWKRIAGELDEAETVSEQMKVGFDRIEDVVRSVRDETVEQVEDAATGMSTTVEDLFDVVVKVSRRTAEQFGFDIGWVVGEEGQEADEAETPLRDDVAANGEEMEAAADSSAKASPGTASAKKVPAEKATTKKPATKKTAAKKATANKTATKKATAKKSASKKSPKKSASKKTASKKATAKRSASKKATAKKTTSKVTATKKTAAKKKAATKKASAKKASSKKAAK